MFHRSCLQVALLLLPLLAAGCATKGPGALSPVRAAAAGAETVTVYAATTRGRVEEPVPQFTSELSDLDYVAYQISIPPTHEPSEIEWPVGDVDPSTDFAVLRETELSQAQFKARIADAASAARKRGAPGAVGLFVHGYNYTFGESLYRLAQLAADSDAGGVPVLFAWPSEGAVSGYVGDMEAATYSRDHLAEVLGALTRSTSEPVTVVGHSMGAWLTVEALRQLRLAGQDRVIRQLGPIVLAAPDIEVDVFRQQMEVIGEIDPPIVVLVSPRDRALAASRYVSGGRPRLGALDVEDPAVTALARETGVQIVDISSLPAQNLLQHDRFVTLAGLAGSPGARGAGLGRGLGSAGAFVFDAVGRTISSPFTWAARAVAP